jgi:hypothetical protein
MIIRKGINKFTNNVHYSWVFEYLKIKFDKNKKNYRIIDIGGAANPWAFEWLTHVADVFTDPNHVEKFKDKNIEVFKINFEDSLEWNVILEDVEKNGKFDFVICSHTLEDLNNPEITCKMINKIGKSGFISMPSKYAENCIFEYKNNIPYKGYHHHRWIFQIKNNILIGYPKMNFHDYINILNISQEKALHTEIAFIWQEKFEYNLIFPDQLMDNRYGTNKLFDLYEKDDLTLE